MRREVLSTRRCLYNLDLVTQTTQIKTSLAGHSTALEAVITPQAGIAQGSGKKTEFELVVELSENRG